VVSNDAEDPLIVARRLLREEFDNNPGLGVRLDRPLSLREGENIGLIAVELESGRLVTVVTDIQKTVCN
jgi:hypothetical protein